MFEFIFQKVVNDSRHVVHIYMMEINALGRCV